MAVASVVTVLDRGVLLRSGDPVKVSRDSAVRRAYLGVTDELAEPLGEE